MTARSLTGNFSKFGTYYLYKLRTLRSMIILNSIFSLLSYPLVFGVLIPAVNSWIDYALCEAQMGHGAARAQELRMIYNSWNNMFCASAAIGIIMLAAVFVMNFVVVNKSFRWLYKKSIVDMDYSLPVSDNTRFCGDLLATFTTCFVPHLAAIATGLVLWQFVPKSTADATVGVFAQIMDNISAVIPQLMLTGFVACVMLVALTLFIMSLCGRPQESRLYPAVFNVIIPIIVSVCIGIIASNVYGSFDSVYGYSIMSETMGSYTAVGSTSPLGLLYYTMMYAFYSSPVGHSDVVFTVPLFKPEVFVPVILITLALFAAAYFLIRNRRAERVGSAFVYGAMKFVVPAIVVFAVVASFASSILAGVFPNPMHDIYNSSSYYSGTESGNVGGYILAMLIITFVLYVVMELISGKGFRKFHVTLLKYVVTVAGSFLICMGLYFSNGMGTAYTVPDASDVISVEVVLSAGSNIYGEGAYGELELTENIQAVTEVHRDIPKDGSEVIGADNSISLIYTLKDGTKLARFYFLSDERYNDVCERLFSVELYVAKEIWKEKFDYAFECGRDEISAVYYSEDKSIDCSISLREFYDALIRDCQNATPERLYTPEHYPEGRNVILVCQKDGLHATDIHQEIYPWYENTLALLEENGVQIYAAAD